METIEAIWRSSSWISRCPRAFYFLNQKSKWRRVGRNDLMNTSAFSFPFLGGTKVLRYILTDLKNERYLFVDIFGLNQFSHKML